ncbi:hypothetical protein FHX80_115136 [Streptomyces brevispora]|uniref:Uncharacterized protein n=1 Tax=Streptomyces brevispora TaxID=887462 RepID=A0A561V4V5_9ACTN|nr:hypothetical protein FHX80_115136 [Streptomyces brevispora]
MVRTTACRDAARTAPVSRPDYSLFGAISLFR